MDNIYITVVSQNYAADVPHQDIPGTDLCCIAKTYHDKSPFPHVVTTEDLQAERLTDEELFELAYPSVSPDHYCIRSIEQALGGVMGEEIAADLTADLPPRNHFCRFQQGWSGRSFCSGQPGSDAAHSGTPRRRRADHHSQFSS